MILLQAAMCLGLLLMAIINGAIFIGIPVLSLILFKVLRKNKVFATKNEKNRLLRKSIAVAAIIIVILVTLIVFLLVHNIDLEYS